MSAVETLGNVRTKEKRKGKKEKTKALALGFFLFLFSFFLPALASSFFSFPISFRRQR
jgi:hypothetical protein